MNTNFSPASRALMVCAAIVIVIAGMKQAADLLVPFLLSVFIAVLTFPLMHNLQKRGMGRVLPLLIVVILVLVAGFSLAWLVGSSMDEFSANMPSYQEKISGQWLAALAWLSSQGFAVNSSAIASQLDPGAAMKLSKSILSGFGNVLTNSFMILLTVIFILLEASSFSNKIDAISESGKKSTMAEKFTDKLRTYMTIKTWLSLTTGVLVTLWLWILGVDYPQLWGVLAFMLNYVPSIGSIIAAVPAVLLALVQAGTGVALLTAAGYLVINVAIGNIIEPRIMGKGLGLSALVVFLSLVFWGWVLGPVGMLLSVPLTMSVKLALDEKDETRWLGTLLGHVD